jgi:transcriptional regulator
MYISKINDCSEQHEAIKAFIMQNSFAILVVIGADGTPHATHLPLELDTTEGGTWRLVGHVARANPAWQMWQQNPKGLAIFSGADAYISSSWYEKPNVSTWNYLAVHFSGVIREVTDMAQKIEILRNLTNHYESSMPQPRFFERLGAEYVQREMRGLVVFEMEVQQIQFAKKLSQNRNDTDYQNIMQKLSDTTNENAQKIAQAMQQLR